MHVKKEKDRIRGQGIHGIEQKDMREKGKREGISFSYTYKRTIRGFCSDRERERRESRPSEISEREREGGGGGLGFGFRSFVLYEVSRRIHETGGMGFYLLTNVRVGPALLFWQGNYTEGS